MHVQSCETRMPPRRDENFIKTHTRKNGAPPKQAEPIINQLKEIVEAHPELKERTIQQGDAFAAVCGEKEPKGYVHVIGLGPTPQDVGTPGLKCYAPTRLQMEILACTKAKSEKDALEQRVLQLQAHMEQRAQQDRNTRYDEDDQGEEDYAYRDDERYDEDDQNLSGQVHGAPSSRPAGHITTAPRTYDAPRSEHDALIILSSF